MRLFEWFSTTVTCEIAYLLELLFLLSLGEDSLDADFFFLSFLWPAFFEAFVSSFPVSQSAKPAVFWICSFNDFSKGWEGATKLGLTGLRCSKSWNNWKKWWNDEKDKENSTEKHSVWKLLKMSHFDFGISTIFCSIEIDLSGNTAAGFPKLAKLKLDHLWHFW